MTKRTFIGLQVDLEPELKQIFEEVKIRLQGERINWVLEENLHVTLHFLGETTDLQIQQVADIIRTETTAKNAFSFRLGGLSYFKRQSAPSALFFNLYDTEALEELAFNLKDGLESLGFKTGKSFTPHLTIGRIKKMDDRKNFYEVVHSNENKAEQTVEVEKVILYESILKPSGSIYQPLEVFYLEG